MNRIQSRCPGRSPFRPNCVTYFITFPIIRAVTASTSLFARFQAEWACKNSLLCVGLDPIRVRLPEAFQQSPTGLRDFCYAIVDATAPYVCAFKPQAAHFGAEGAEDQLAEVIGYIHARYPDIPVILDAKRGDIGSTAEFYAREAFERYAADVVTVNPYLGPESLQPYLAYPGRGIAVLCRTSNPESEWLQAYCLGEELGEEPVYLRVARAAVDWNADNNVMLVAGATFPEELARIRDVVGDMPLLVPGIGAQGGDLRAALLAGLDQKGQGLVINASRSVLYAGAGEQFAAAAETAARDARNAIRDSR